MRVQRVGDFHRIVYHGDRSGEVEIAELDAGGQPAKTIKIPSRALFEFVAAHVRDERIAQLEQATPDEILGVRVPKP